MMKLSSDQRWELECAVFDWHHDVGCSSEPADKERAEEAIRCAYTAAWLNAPKEIIWTRSPKDACQKIKTFSPAKPVWFPVLERGRTYARNEIVSEIGASLYGHIKRAFKWEWLDDIRKVVGAKLLASDWANHGCHAADWLGPLDFCASILGITAAERMRGVIEVAKSAGWWWPFSEVCVVTERPYCVKFNEEGLFHCADGPALAWDGWELYVWRGVWVTPDIILNPERLTVSKIREIQNTNVRRCAIERYGMERFLADSKAEQLDIDEYGILYRQSFRNEETGILKVTNATRDKDGTFKDYFLYVPPDMKKARQAVAWTFGIESEQRYSPRKQT